MRSVLPLVLLLLLLSGCGYQFERPAGTWQGTAPLLYVELLDNRTTRAFLENEATTQVVERFGRSRRFQVTEDPARAQLVLGGRLDSYGTTAVAYNQADDILVYRAQLTAAVALSRQDNGKILWKGQLTETEEFSASNDRALQQVNEKGAIRRLCQLLADDLFARVSDDF